MDKDYANAKALTVTFLTPVSFASLNGGDKEADNITSIKKLTRETAHGTREYPYVSSQAIRRALRDQLATLGHELSEAVTASEKKGAATTQCEPEKYIDDDLFGYMDAAKSGTNKRTSPVRVSPLTAFSPYHGDLDFGTNYMSVKAGGDPNIFETEIHSGLYRGTVLIELDRVGSGDGFTRELSAEQKTHRVIGLLAALQNLWSSGRQSRFLADLTPKFVAAAITSAKAPIFLESVQIQDGGLNGVALREILADHQDVIIDHVFGARSGLFNGLIEGTVTVGEAFQTMAGWVTKHYRAGV
jgi:CRISPR-associated protein Cst2